MVSVTWQLTNQIGTLSTKYSCRTANGELTTLLRGHRCVLMQPVKMTSWRYYYVATAVKDLEPYHTKLG